MLFWSEYRNRAISKKRMGCVMGLQSLFSAASLMFCLLVRGDSVVTVTGAEYVGEIVAETPQVISIDTADGVFVLHRDLISSIQRTGEVPSTQQKSGESAGAVATPAYDQRGALRLLGKQWWAGEIKQIPSTVVNAGVLKYVPYSSFRTASGFEVNVYGDPSDPACVEIGVYDSMATSLVAREACRQWVVELFGSDREITNALAAMRSDEGKMPVHDGDLVVEITPPTAQDSYGGWWISVYNEKKLNESRASESETTSITVQIAQPMSQAAPVSSTAAKPSTFAAVEPTKYWQSSDVVESRRQRTQLTDNGSAPSSKTVYVRGYYRKNGSYVRPHTRSR